ncbi:MAG: hypothetical protein AABY06_00115 [Nanoarchaeota archaeon]
MKKTLSTILLSIGLIFGANQLKGQIREDIEFKNHDKDDFNEEVYGAQEEGLNEKTNIYKKNKMGLTIIFYSDKNNDNFHESIRVFNCDKMRRVVLEDFYINKETGLVNYEYKVFPLTPNKWDKYFAHKSFLSYVKENLFNSLPLKDKKYYPSLTKEALYNLYPGFGDRVKRLINASKDKNALESMLKEERYHWSSVYP